jgi:hypothetical protein
MASIKSRLLSFEEQDLWNDKILPLIDKLSKPKEDSYHKWKILKYPNYFVDTYYSFARGILN